MDPIQQPRYPHPHAQQQYPQPIVPPAFGYATPARTAWPPPNVIPPEAPRRRGRLAAGIAATAIAAASLEGVAGGLVVSADKPAVTTTTAAAAANVQGSVQDVVAKALPAVVEIGRK